MMACHLTSILNTDLKCLFPMFRKGEVMQSGSNPYINVAESGQNGLKRNVPFNLEYNKCILISPPWEWCFPFSQ